MKDNSVNSSQESILESLQDSQVSNVQLDPQMLSIQFQFTFGPGRDDVVIEMSNTVHIAISKDPEDEELPALVGEVSITPVLDGGLAVLTALKYPFKSTEDRGSVFTYPSIRLYHFHLEGDICAEVVCAQYKIRIVNRRNSE